jgi:hypothetical protein
MEPKIDSPLTIGPNGRHIAVTGPIGGWEADEHSATFAVMITQVQADGKIVLAVGHNPNPFTPHAANWNAAAEVVGAGHLTAGLPATGFAIASVDETGGYTPYPWEVDSIQLVEETVVLGAPGGR